MIRYELSGVIVDDSALFGPTGQVTRWVNEVKREVLASTKAVAPSGLKSGRIDKTRRNARYPAGSLAASIKANSARGLSSSIQTITVSANTPYALFVIKGTKSPIFSRRDRLGRFATSEDQRGLYLPAGAGFAEGPKKFVSGQKANNFLAAGIDAASVKHPALGAGVTIGRLR